MSEDKASPMGLFERYLSLWVALCIVAGVGLGMALPSLFALIASIEYASVNLVVAIFKIAIVCADKVTDGETGQIARTALI